LLNLFGINVNIFKKNISAQEYETLERLQRHLILLLPESLEVSQSIHPLPAHIDWRYVQAASVSVVKLQRCITESMKIAPKSKQELANLLEVINNYLAKPARERSQEAELEFRTQISKLAPKILRLWVQHHGFTLDKLWDRYLHIH